MFEDPIARSKKLFWYESPITSHLKGPSWTVFCHELCRRSILTILERPVCWVTVGQSNWTVHDWVIHDRPISTLLHKKLSFRAVMRITNSKKKNFFGVNFYFYLVEFSKISFEECCSCFCFQNGFIILEIFSLWQSKQKLLKFFTISTRFKNLSSNFI